MQNAERDVTKIDLEQIVLQGLEIESIEKEKASERKALTRKYGLKPEDAKYSQSTQGQTRDIVANQLGISGKHWERMKFIYQHRDCLSNDEYVRWQIGKLSTSKAYNKITQDIKFNDILDDIWKLLDEMQDDIFEYENSYLHVDIQQNISNTLWGISDKRKRDKIKNEVFANFYRLTDFNKDILDKRYDKLSEAKHQIKELKKKLQRKNVNNA